MTRRRVELQAHTAVSSQPEFCLYKAVTLKTLACQFILFSQLACDMSVTKCCVCILINTGFCMETGSVSVINPPLINFK